MANGNGIEISTPWVTLQGTGLVTIMLFLTVLMLGFTAYTSYQITIEHRAIVTGLNDVYIAVMTPPEVKSNMPYLLKERLQEKMLEKSKDKLNKDEAPKP
jgi:hypothetical protein